jgi:hypothetical protein
MIAAIKEPCGKPCTNGMIVLQINNTKAGYAIGIVVFLSGFSGGGVTSYVIGAALTAVRRFNNFF